MSFSVVIWAVFGGLATIYGPIAAVFVLFPLLEFVPLLARMYRMMIFGRRRPADPPVHARGFCHGRGDKMGKA